MTEIAFNPLESPERPEMVLDLRDGSNEQVSIIIVHHERPEYLNICMQSIHIMSNLNNFEVIVVDNPGKDDAVRQDTVDFLNVLEKEGYKVVRNEENLQWSAAANRGAAIADKHSKYLLFMHCDTVVLNQGWIDLLIGVAESRNSGFVGTQLSNYFIQRQSVNFIPEWCVLVTRECWEDCGPWPEELPLVGHSFIMTMRAQHKGYKPTAMTNPVVHHYRAPSFNPNEYERISQKAMTIIPKLLTEAQA